MKFGKSQAHSSPFNGYFNGHISAVAAWGGTRNHPHTARPARPSPHGASRAPSTAWLAQMPGHARLWKHTHTFHLAPGTAWG